MIKTSKTCWDFAPWYHTFFFFRF